MVKTPLWDRPKGLGASGKGNVPDPTSIPIKVGTRVTLVFSKKFVLVQTTKIVGEASFEGEVVQIAEAPADWLGPHPGELVSFTHDDVRWID